MTNKIHWNRRTYTEEKFRDSWADANSIAHCARLLGLKKSAGLYKHLRATAEILGLNEEHMSGQGWNIGDKAGLRFLNRKPSSEYFVKGRNTSNSTLKSRILEENLLDNRCYAPYCPITFEIVDPFTGEPSDLKLTLDHIDGDNTNNLLENLRFLCNYCHPYTPTFSRNLGRVYKPSKSRCSCGGKKDSRAVMCQECRRQRA